MKKRGQFYLIAAVVIIMIILSLSTVSNYLITRKTPVKFYDLGEELGEESGRVVDYGVYSEEDISVLMSNFSDTFAEYSSETELIFVFGNKSSMSIIAFSSEETGEITIIGDSFSATVGAETELTRSEDSFNPGSVGDEINVSIKEKTYDFNLREGENFFFILTKESGEETHVTTPEEPGENLTDIGLPTGP